MGLRRAGPPIRPPRPQRPEASPGETGARLQPRRGPWGFNEPPPLPLSPHRVYARPPHGRRRRRLLMQNRGSQVRTQSESRWAEAPEACDGERGGGGVSWRLLLPPSQCPGWPRPEPGQNWVGRRKEGPAQTRNSPPRRPVSPATAPATQAARPRASVARRRVALRGTTEWSVSPAEVGGTPQMAMGLCYKSYHPTSVLSRNLSPKGCEWSWGHGTSRLCPAG